MGQQPWAGSCYRCAIPRPPFLLGQRRHRELALCHRGWPERRACCIRVPQARTDSLGHQILWRVLSAGSLGIGQLWGQGDGQTASVQTWGQCQVVWKCPEQQAELELAHLSRLALGSHRVWSVCGHSMWHLLQTGLCLFGESQHRRVFFLVVFVFVVFCLLLLGYFCEFRSLRTCFSLALRALLHVDFSKPCFLKMHRSTSESGAFSAPRPRARAVDSVALTSAPSHVISSAPGTASSLSGLCPPAHPQSWAGWGLQRPVHSSFPTCPGMCDRHTWLLG